MKTDVYQTITDTIIAQLEQGIRPWFQPWNGEHAAGRITRPLRGNGVPYRGINVVMLWAAAVERGYSAPIWMTFRQAHELGAHVRKGERGNLVVFANTLTRTETDEETGEETEQEIPYMKGYSVFNVEQIDGLPAQYMQPAQTIIDPVERIAHADAFIGQTKAKIHQGGNRAFYTVADDYIQMPPFEVFREGKLLRDDPARTARITHQSAVQDFPANYPVQIAGANVR